MAGTDAQKTAAGRKKYGENYHEGIKAEQRAARVLRGRGYSVKVSAGSRGAADLVATHKKTGAIKRVQVKEFKSRAFLTEGAARRRVAGAPFFTTLRGAIDEIWIYDRDGRRYEIGGD